MDADVLSKSDIRSLSSMDLDDHGITYPLAEYLHWERLNHWPLAFGGARSNIRGSSHQPRSTTRDKPFTYCGSTKAKSNEATDECTFHCRDGYPDPNFPPIATLRSHNKRSTRRGFYLRIQDRLHSNDPVRGWHRSTSVCVGLLERCIG